MSWRETNSPTTIPFWARCNNPFHLFVLTTFFTQVSLVTIGHRAGRSSAFGLAEAELLSASSRPSGLPSRCACCVALTPLSKRHFFEVISCAVKGRTTLRPEPAHAEQACSFLFVADTVVFADAWSDRSPLPPVTRQSFCTTRLPIFPLLRCVYAPWTQKFPDPPPHACRTADAARVATVFYHTCRFGAP